MLQFDHYWSCKVSDVGRGPVQPGLSSPVFRTLYNNLAFDWRFKVCTSKTDETFVRFYPALVGNSSGSKSCVAVWMISVGNVQSKFYTDNFDTSKDDSGYYALTKESLHAEAVNGIVTFHFHVKIAEAEFRKHGITVLGEALPKPQQNFPLFNLFDRILVEMKVPGQNPQKPEGDVHQKFLDFHIQTSDGHVIWCHSLVLVSGNEKFEALIGAGLEETQLSFLKVRFSSDAMKEVLHVIYRGSVSAKFQELHLDEILDAANDYNLPVLKTACEHQLLEQCEELDGERCARILELANRYGLMEVKKKALDWASENEVAVLDSDAGKELKRNLYLEILSASDAKHAQHKNM